MKILKKNQITILVIALMLVSAGYLNFTAMNKNKTVETSKNLNNQEVDYAGIGDAKLVSSNGVVENNNEEALVPNENEEINNTKETAIVENNESKTSTKNTNEIENTSSNTEIATTTSATSKETKEYFSSSKLNRETMYSQMLESYRKILENETISETQKAIAQTEIKNINDTKNKIMICENLIRTKGIEDLVIFVNDKRISIVVRTDKLEQEQIAQIQNIVEREMRNRDRKYTYKQ